MIPESSASAYFSDTDSDTASSSRHSVEQSDDQPEPRRPDDRILDAVVHVYFNFAVGTPNYFRPWQLSKGLRCVTGVVISGRRIVTCCDLKEMNFSVSVKRRKAEKNYVARLLHYSYELDIAVFTVDDDSFWKTDSFLTFGPLPERKLHLTVVICERDEGDVTLSDHAIERVVTVKFRNTGLVTLKIVASPMKSGIAGSPLLNEKDQVVGIAYSLGGNKAYFTPALIVEKFLSEIEKIGHYRGFCHKGFHWQCMRHHSLRRYKKMKQNQTGVLVCNVPITSPARDVLHEGDVVLAVDGTTVSNDGTIDGIWGDGISFEYIFRTKVVSDIAKLHILREGEEMEIEYGLRSWHENWIVPFDVDRRQPKYYMCGGLVFISLSRANIHFIDNPDRVQPRLFHHTYGISQFKKFVDEEIVILSFVNNVKISVKYQCFTRRAVHKFNDVEVRNLKHLAQLVESCEEEFFRFQLEGAIVVLGREEALQANNEIMEFECIPSHTNIKGLNHSKEKGIEIVGDLQ